jgi:hypothetical protein
LPKYLLFDLFPNFAPNSAASPIQRTLLTINSINETSIYLSALAEKYSDRSFPILTIEDFLNLKNFSSSRTEDLSSLFGKFGSDKGQPNDYYKLYSFLLDSPSSITAILEIGLGTNNLRIASNMGVFGKPGASIRAFKEFLPNAKIYGADIDRDILFTEDRIETNWVDQCNLVSLKNLFVNMDRNFDLIIDDGLHAPNANLATLLLSLDYCSKGGYVVIEDISRESRAIWQIAQTLLPRDLFESHILQGKVKDIFIVKIL